MKIDYHDRFVKHYAKRIRPNGVLDTAFTRRMNTFLQNSKHPLLRDHALTGDLIGFRSFSITGDIRVIYRTMGSVIQLYDIGTHTQVYS